MRIVAPDISVGYRDRGRSGPQNGHAHSSGSPSSKSARSGPVPVISATSNSVRVPGKTSSSSSRYTTGQASGPGSLVSQHSRSRLSGAGTRSCRCSAAAGPGPSRRPASAAGPRGWAATSTFLRLRTPPTAVRPGAAADDVVPRPPGRNRRDRRARAAAGHRRGFPGRCRPAARGSLRAFRHGRPCAQRPASSGHRPGPTHLGV